MGTQLQPEAETKENENPSTPNPTEGTENQEKGSEQTPNNGPSSETRLALMESLMRQQHQTISSLQEQLRKDAETRTRQAEQQREQQPENSSEFFSRPASNIREIIREETLRAVEPLYEFKKQLESESKYDKLKNQFRSDPRFREIFPKIEGMVDQLMQGSEANEGNMQIAVLSAVGSYSLGMIPGQAPVNNTPAPRPSTQPTTGGTVVSPPHIRPTAPLNVGEPNAPKIRELNELEARLARENNQTPAEFLAWLDEDPTKVAYSQIGKKPKEEVK